MLKQRGAQTKGCSNKGVLKQRGAQTKGCSNKGVLKQRGAQTKGCSNKGVLKQRGAQTKGCSNKGVLKQRGAQTKGCSNKGVLKQRGAQTKGCSNKGVLKQRGAQTKGCSNKGVLKQRGAAQTKGCSNKGVLKQRGAQTKGCSNKGVLKQRGAQTKEGTMKHKHISYLLTLLLLSLSLFTQAQTPLPARDFILNDPAVDPANNTPQGIWSDGTTMWVVDIGNPIGAGDERIFAYNLSTGVRDTMKGFDLPTANDNAQGIWSDGTTLWVADGGANQLFAYTLMGGAPDAGKNITLDVGNGTASGIWSNGTTLWVADSGTSTVFAYTLMGAPDASKNIRLHVDNDNPRGIWGQTTTTGTPTTTLWVADRSDNRIFAYDISNITDTDPTTVGVSRDIAKEFDLNVANNFAQGIWSDGITLWVADSRDRIYAYILRAGDMRGTRGARSTGDEFNLHSIPFLPRGIWSDGTTMWVADPDDPDRIYAYNLMTRMRDSAKGFDLATDNGDAEGIWSDGTTMWVANNLPAGTQTVFAYDISNITDMDPMTVGVSRDMTQEFVLDTANDDARGLWSDGTTLWVADSGTRTVFAYTLASRSRDTSKDFVLDVANSDARGIWSDGTTLWVADLGDEQIYAYNLSMRMPDGTLMPDTSREFALDTLNANPEGLWSDGTTLWVADSSSLQVFAYTLPVAPVLTPVSLAGVPLPVPAGMPIQTMNTTPEYIFESDKAGTILYGGSCARTPSPTPTTLNAVAGSTTVTYGPLMDGEYLDCTITVTGATGIASEPLMVTAFTVDTTAPEVEPIGTQTVSVGSMVTLTATVRDRVGATLDYVWSQRVGDTNVMLNSATGTAAVAMTGTATITTTFMAPATAGDLAFTLTVTDDAGNPPASDSVTISVITPSVNASANPSRAAGSATVTLTTTLMPAGLTGTIYAWSQVVAPGSPTVTLLNPTGSMTTFTAPNSDDILTFRVNATNGAESFSDTVSVTVDATRPTVDRIVAPATASGDFPITIEFSEPVTGFDETNIGVGSGTASNFAGSGSSYTATITPSAGLLVTGGTITIGIAANVAMDSVGNQNEAATEVEVRFVTDTTPPTLTGVALTGIPLADLPMPTLIDSNSPQYTFRSTEAGTIEYTGTCTMPTMPTAMAAIQPPNTVYTVTFNDLAENTYSDCMITVEDAAGNRSNTLTVPEFTVDTVPTVDTVIVNSTQDRYGIGETIVIQVAFTEVVVVTGLPVLLLNNGGQAVYSTGSNSEILTFNYEVSPGQGTANLDYSGTDALSLAGASINDDDTSRSLSGNPATPDLPPSGGGLRNNDGDLISIIAPGIIGVSGESGNYRVGDTVTIHVQFSEEIMVSPDAGLPIDEILRLTLETGDIDRMATFSRLTTTATVPAVPNNTLEFIYRVEEGDRSQDLAYTAIGALVAVGDTLVTGIASGLSNAELLANLNDILSLPALDAASSLAGSSDIVVGVLLEEQNARLNEILLPKIARAMSAATVDAITRRIENGGGDSQASLSSALSSRVSDILPSGLSSLKDLDLSWLKSFTYDFLMDKAEQSARSGSIGLDALGSGFDIKGMLGGFDIKRMLGNSEFVMPLNASGDGTGSGATSSMVLWGSGDYNNLSDNDDGLNYDGDIYSINLGIDSQISQETLLGVSVNWSNSDFDYRDAITAQSGDYGYKLYGINPYISWSPQGLGGSNLWATVGYGIGEIESQIDGIEKVETDTRQYQFSGGGRYILSSSADQLSQLSIKGDLTLLRVDIDRSVGFLGNDIDSQSFRLLLQGSSVFNHDGYSFTPSLEGGLRYDLGDGDTGGGIELSPAFTYKSLDDHILIEGRGRYLIAGQHDQWGLSVLARIDQARHDGRGLSFSMHPTWGQSQGQAEQLTAHNGSRFNDHRATKAEAQMKTELSYGMHMSHILGQTMLFTPYAEFTLGENARYYQFGQRLSIGELLNLSFKLSHHQRRGYADDSHLGLESAINF